MSYPSDKDVQESGELGYEVGRQAQYECNRAGNCGHSINPSIDKDGAYWSCTNGTFSDFPPCAERWQECPLSKPIGDVDSNKPRTSGE